MSETVKACPNCNDPSLENTTNNNEYRCRGCWNEFEKHEAITREPLGGPDSGRRGSPHTRALLDADPSEVSTNE